MVDIPTAFQAIPPVVLVVMAICVIAAQLTLVLLDRRVALGVAPDGAPQLPLMMSTCFSIAPPEPDPVGSSILSRRTSRDVTAPMMSGRFSTPAQSGSSAAPASSTRRPLVTDVDPMVSVASPHTTRPVGVRRGKGYADEFAQGFIGWCRRGVGRKFSITVGDLQGLAEHDYAAALGIPMPPARSMLSAIQRLEGVEVRHGLRGRLSGGRKTTVYTISMDADAASNDRAA